MTKEEKNMYNAALKRKWDNQNVLDNAVRAAKEEGIKEGIKEERAKAEKLEEKQKTVLALKSMNMLVTDIAKAVGLSLEAVETMLVG